MPRDRTTWGLELLGAYDMLPKCYPKNLSPQTGFGERRGSCTFEGLILPLEVQGYIKGPRILNTQGMRCLATSGNVDSLSKSRGEGRYAPSNHHGSGWHRPLEDHVSLQAGSANHFHNWKS